MYGRQLWKLFRKYSCRSRLLLRASYIGACCEARSFVSKYEKKGQQMAVSREIHSNGLLVIDSMVSYVFIYSPVSITYTEPGRDFMQE